MWACTQTLAPGFISLCLPLPMSEHRILYTTQYSYSLQAKYIKHS
uniref:Uncharacterized protein n=1 Tax=Anguilla anguilla TaxID=7936 RepID=A0A0E9W216_ANGAN